MKKIVISPYIRFIKSANNTISIYNFLLNKFQRYYQKSGKLYQYCLTPKSLDEVIEMFDKKEVMRLIQLYQLVDPKTIWNMHKVTTLEIETSTVCNWKCEYCPVQYGTRRQEFIDFELFKNILKKGIDYGHIKEVALHSYNEPSLDENFEMYLEAIYRTPFKLALFTNGSYLDESKLNQIQSFGRRSEITFNFPSQNRETFIKMTGANTYEQSIWAISKAIEKGIKTIINVQGRGEQRKYEADAIQQRFPQSSVVSYDSFDRAGALKNSYKYDLYISKPYMAGCYMLTRSVYVNIHGELFMCCNDFNKKYLLGSINDRTIFDVLSDEKASIIRQKAWGAVPADGNFICRYCSLMCETINSPVYKLYNQMFKCQ